MEILLFFFLSLAIVFLIATVSVLYSMLLKERKRADTAEQQADQKLQEALMRASEQLAKAEKRIRADAIRKSTAVVRGKVAEQLVPFRDDFPFNPRNTRFLGSPVDLLVFVGLTEGDLDKVIFIEVKTGKSQLSRRQRQLRDVIDAGEVYWEEMRV